MKTKFYITNCKNSNKKGRIIRYCYKTMCQDKNEVINYYRYINMPDQVRVRLVILIKIDTEA